jgi:hypothetical protein
MPAPTDPKLKAQIKRAYVNSKATAVELAERFGVSDRSIQNWAKNEHWDAEREANSVVSGNVIDLESARQPRENPRSVRRGNPQGMSSIEVVNEAIADLYGDLSNAVGKDKAAIANALQRLIEYRDKLQPPTLDDLANLVIEQLDKWQLSPRDFAIHLKQRQEERNRA